MRKYKPLGSVESSSGNADRFYKGYFRMYNAGSVHDGGS